MNATISIRYSSALELLPDEGDTERTKHGQWTSTGNGFPHEALPVANECSDRVTKPYARPASLCNVVHYIPAEYDSSNVVWDCYGDAIPSPFQREKVQIAAERPCARLAPPHGVGRYIPVEYETPDVVWDCYGNPVSHNGHHKNISNYRGNEET